MTGNLIHEMTKKRAEEQKKTYTEALAEVMLENPEEAEKYVNESDSGKPQKTIKLSEVESSEKELDIQAQIMALQYGVGYENAIKIVMKMPKNEDLVKKYIEE